MRKAILALFLVGCSVPIDTDQDTDPTDVDTVPHSTCAQAYQEPIRYVSSLSDVDFQTYSILSECYCFTLLAGQDSVCATLAKSSTLSQAEVNATIIHLITENTVMDEERIVAWDYLCQKVQTACLTGKPIQ